jgi:hypothetical protein
MKFHHVGVPATEQRPGETYLEGARLYVTDAAASPYQIEWLRFEADSPMPAELKSGPHIAFTVDDLDQALVGKTVLIPPFEPLPGVRAAFITDDGAVVELMQKIA